MNLSESQVVDLISFSVDIPIELMEGIIESVLQEANRAIDPTFIDSEVKYVGQIESFSRSNMPNLGAELLNHCLSGLEMFTIESPRDNGVVFLRKGDEMIILTEHNAEVIQEDDMAELMAIVEDTMANELEKMMDDGGSRSFR